MSRPGFFHQFIHGQGQGPEGPRRTKPTSSDSVLIILGCMLPLLLTLAVPFIFFIGLAIVTRYGAHQNCARGDTIIAALAAYHAKHGQYPDALATLVADGQVASLPKAALGGSWFYRKEGSTFTLVAGSILIYDNVQFAQHDVQFTFGTKTSDEEDLRQASREMAASIWAHKAKHGKLPKSLEDAINARESSPAGERAMDVEWQYVPNRATQDESEWFSLRGWKRDAPSAAITYEGGKWISIAD